MTAKCETCNGTGGSMLTGPCRECNGTGLGASERCSVCNTALWHGSCRTHGDAAAQAEYKARTAEEWAEIAHRNSVMNAEYRKTHRGGESLRQRAAREDRESDSPAGDEVQS